METLDLIDTIKTIDKSHIILGPFSFYIYPGGELYELCEKQGIYEPEDFEGWVKMKVDPITGMEFRAKDFSWNKDPEYVESISLITRYKFRSLKDIVSNPVKNLALLPIIISSKLRWKYRFFRLLLEFKVLRIIRGFFKV